MKTKEHSPDIETADVSQPSKRRRLSPSKRLDQLLDSATDYIIQYGLNSLTIDSLASHAGVSKPLLYRYFDSRSMMLKELLLRENTRARARISDAVERAIDFDEVIHFVVCSDFDQAVKGDAHQILLEQPDIAVALPDLEQEGEIRLGNQLIDALIEMYPMKRGVAANLIRMASAASRRAAAHYARHGGDRYVQAEVTIAFILGALRHSYSALPQISKNKPTD